MRLRSAHSPIVRPCRHRRVVVAGLAAALTSTAVIGASIVALGSEVAGSTAAPAAETWFA